MVNKAKQEPVAWYTFNDPETLGPVARNTLGYSLSKGYTLELP